MMELKLIGSTYDELVEQARAWLNADGANTAVDTTTTWTPRPAPIPQATPTMPATTPPMAIPQTTPPASVPMSAPAPQPIPTASPTYSQEDLMVAAARVMSTVGMPAMQQLLGQFGVQAITQLQPTQFGAFAQRLRELGAAI